MARFTGQAIFIAGAAGGIGSAIADRLAAEGARLVLADKAPVRAPDGCDALTLHLDATVPESWTTARDEALAWAPELCGVVHAIGLLGPEAPVSELQPEEWSRVIAVNLTSAFLALSAFLPALTKRADSRFVLLASIAGKEGNARQAAYSAAKGGLIALTKSAAKEVASDGVRVNCIAPTMIEGPLMAAMTEDQISSLLAKIPMGRAGQPHEVASLASWLLSEESSYSTGQCFDLSGGRATY